MLNLVKSPFTTIYPTKKKGDTISDTDIYITIPEGFELISINSIDGSVYVTAHEARLLANALQDAAYKWEKLNHETTHPFL